MRKAASTSAFLSCALFRRASQPSAVMLQRCGTSSSSAPSGQDTANSSTSAMFQRGAEARSAIAQLWQSSTTSPSGTAADAKKRFASVQAILEKFSISEATQRSADVTPALGEAVDRLLLLTVPLGETSDVSQLETVLGVIGKSGSQLSIRTVQHLFARVSSYPEAIAVFYAMRRKNVAMDMHAYHAMIYSLQRLEEESWAAKFANERLALHQASSSSLSSASQGEEGDRSFVSEQALDFIMNGVDNQLIPEQKPWLGRVLFADGEQQAAGRDSFDALGAQWVERYRQGDVAAVTRSASTRAKKRQQKQQAGVQK